MLCQKNVVSKSKRKKRTNVDCLVIEREKFCWQNENEFVLTGRKIAGKCGKWEWIWHRLVWKWLELKRRSCLRKKGDTIVFETRETMENHPFAWTVYRNDGGFVVTQIWVQSIFKSKKVRQRFGRECLCVVVWGEAGSLKVISRGEFPVM